LSGFSSKIRTSRSGSAYGSGRMSTPRATVNIAVLAPMPMARVATAASVNAGLRRRTRSA
jgi:hypothetical protein